MKLKSPFLYVFVFCLFLACESKNPAEPTSHTDKKEESDRDYRPISISKEQLFDKVFGMLVGSAIGDAMGAPTEMWSRDNIKVEYGFVDQLDDMFRAPSPEGTWQMNLPAGGTTDDTRWKALLGEFMIQEGDISYSKKGVNPFHFAEFIVEKYKEEIRDLKNIDSFDPAPFEKQAMEMAWLQEWAIVAKPFSENKIEEYAYALSHFYGGEVTCAGMLYSPMIGLMYPGSEMDAYQNAYRLSLFDLGYARDISALTAAMVAKAFDPQSSSKDVLEVLKQVDPEGFFSSRLVGRSSYRLYRDAFFIVNEAKQMEQPEVDLKELRLPFQNRDTLYQAQMQEAFHSLDSKNQDMPFHAGEIHLINLTALLFADFDFQRSLEFVVNYGRDNDTVAAITGAILGAFYGFDQLPKKMAQQVLDTNKNKLGIDLKDLANQLTEHLIDHQAVVLKKNKEG